MKRISVMFMIAAIIMLTGCTTVGLDGDEQESKFSNQFEVFSIPYGYLLVDNKTGCQYIRGPYGESSFTPRLNQDGTPYCEDK